MVCTKRADIHTLTFSIDDFAVLTKDLVNAIHLEQASDRFFLLVYQIDLLMVSQLQFQLIREFFFFALLAVCHDNDRAIEGKIPDHFTERFNFFTFMGNYKNST